MKEDLMELVEKCPVDLTPSEPRLLRYLEKRGENIVSEYRGLGFVKATEERHQKNLRISKRQKIYEFEYRVITIEAIRKFLQRKVKLYDKEHKPKPKKEKTSSGFPSLDSPGLRAMKELFARGGLIHIPIVEPSEPQPGDVLDTSVLERMREEMMRSCTIPEPLMGMAENMRSAQEQIQIHREKTCDYDKLDPETIGLFEWNEERVEDYDGLPPIGVLETFKEHKAREVFDYFTIASVNSVPDPLLLGRIDGDDNNRWFIAQWSNDVCLDDLI